MVVKKSLHKYTETSQNNAVAAHSQRISSWFFYLFSKLEYMKANSKRIDYLNNLVEKTVSRNGYQSCLISSPLLNTRKSL